MYGGFSCNGETFHFLITAIHCWRPAKQACTPLSLEHWFSQETSFSLARFCSSAKFVQALENKHPSGLQEDMVVLQKAGFNSNHV